jgi:hypothetical protein
VIHSGGKRYSAQPPAIIFEPFRLGNAIDLLRRLEDSQSRSLKDLALLGDFSAASASPRWRSGSSPKNGVPHLITPSLMSRRPGAIAVIRMRYSYRSATIGSTCVARRAGR